MAQWKLSRRHPACVECGHVFEDGEAHFSRLEVNADGVARADVCRNCWPETSDPGWIWWRARRQAPTKKGLAVDWDVLTQVFESLGTKAEELRASGDSVPAASTAAESSSAESTVAEAPAVESPAAEASEDRVEGAAGEAASTDESSESDAPQPAEPELLHPAERLERLRYLLALLLIRKRRLMLVRAVRRGDGEALVLRRPRRTEQIEVRAFDLEPEQMDAVRAELQRLFEGEALDGGEVGEGAVEGGLDDGAGEDAEGGGDGSDDGDGALAAADPGEGGAAAAPTDPT